MIPCIDITMTLRSSNHIDWLRSIAFLKTTRRMRTRRLWSMNSCRLVKLLSWSNIPYLRKQKLVAEIAKQLKRFHQVDIPGSKEPQLPQLWNDIFKFYERGSYYKSNMQKEAGGPEKCTTQTAPTGTMWILNSTHQPNTTSVPCEFTKTGTQLTTPGSIP